MMAMRPSGNEMPSSDAAGGAPTSKRRVSSTVAAATTTAEAAAATTTSAWQKLANDSHPAATRAGKRTRHPPQGYGDDAEDLDIEFYAGADSAGGSLSEDYEEHETPRGRASSGGPRKRSNRKLSGTSVTGGKDAADDGAVADGDVPSALRRRAQVRDASRRFRERKKAEMGALEERVSALTAELHNVRTQLHRAQAGHTGGDGAAEGMIEAQQQRIAELEAALATRAAAPPRGGSDKGKSRKQVTVDVVDNSSGEVAALQGALQSLQSTLQAVAEEVRINAAAAAALPRRLLEAIHAHAWMPFGAVSAPESSPSPPAHAAFSSYAPSNVMYAHSAGTGQQQQHAVPPLPLQFAASNQYPALGSMTMRDVMLPTGGRDGGSGYPHMFPMFMSPHLAALSAARQSQSSPVHMHGMPLAHAPAQPPGPPSQYNVMAPVPQEYSHLIARAMVDICAFANDDWKVEVRTPDLTVFSRPSDLPVFSIKTAHISDLPPAILAEAVWRNFTDEAIARRVTPDTVQRCAVMETYAPDTSLVYRSEHFTFPTHSRDFVYLAHRLDACTLATVRSFSAPTQLPPPSPFDPPGAVAAAESDLMWLGIMRSVQHPGLPVTEPTVVRADLYEGYMVRAGPGGRGAILITIGQIDTKHGLASIPEEHLRATFESVPGYVRNMITAARELAADAEASAPSHMQSFSLLAGASIEGAGAALHLPITNHSVEALAMLTLRH